MLQYTELQYRRPIAILGDGCDTTTAAIQKVSQRKKQLLTGWGASTAELHGAKYFVSTSDSVTQYFAGFLRLCQKFGIFFLSLLTGSTNQADSFASDYFRTMVRDYHGHRMDIRSILRLSKTCGATCQLMPTDDAPSHLAASAARAVFLLANKAHTTKVV